MSDVLLLEQGGNLLLTDGTDLLLHPVPLEVGSTAWATSHRLDAATTHVLAGVGRGHHLDARATYEGTHHA